MIPPRLLPAAVTSVSFETIYRSLFFSRHLRDDAFNTDIASYFGARDVHTFSSLMRTVYASLLPLKKETGKRYVLLPRYSCPSFAHGILANNLEIRYVDQDAATLSYDLKDLQKKMKSDVLAVIVPHFFGLAHPIDTICDMARAASVTVIEGVDYSIGTVYKGRKLGTYGDIGILNFQEGKALPIGGGALFINNKNLVNAFAQFKDRYREQEENTVLRTIGFAIGTRPLFYFLIRTLFDYLKRDIKQVSFEDTIRETQSEYDFEFNEDSPLLALNTFQKNLGRLLLKRMKNDMCLRHRNAMLLEKSLKNTASVSLIPRHEGIEEIHYIRYPVLVQKKNRAQLIRTLKKSGIEASSMYTDHGMHIDPKEFPGASQIYHTLLTLPVHPFCTEQDIKRMVRVVSRGSEL